MGVWYVKRPLNGMFANMMNPLLWGFFFCCALYCVFLWGCMCINTKKQTHIIDFKGLFHIVFLCNCMRV